MERPLSPFMFPTWCRVQITSLLSILHRFTGIALAVGSILDGLVAGCRGCRRRGIRRDARLHGLADWGAAVVRLVGRFLLSLCGGIRHLAWDAGYGFEIRDAYRTGYVVLATTVVLAVLAWLYVFLA